MAGQNACHLDQLRQLRAHVVEDLAQAHALAHPLAQDGRRGMPDIELRIQLAAEPLDVDQRFLQQDELRLQLHVEAARDVEQAHQQGGERDVLERPVEYRLAHRAHGRFDLVHPRTRGHPPGLDMQLRHAAVVAVEHGEEIGGEIVLVARIERADDAEVDRGVERARRIVDHHEDVAGMHVGVEEVVPEHLGEEDAHAVLGQQLDVGAGAAQPLHVRDRDAMDALHHHDVQAAVVPVDLGDVEQIGAGEVALEL